MSRSPQSSAAQRSLASWLASLPEAERVRRLASLSQAELELLRYDWPTWARAEQLSPWTLSERGRGRDVALEQWRFWLFLAGRGAGKSRSGSETVIEEAREQPGLRIALVARTAADTRDVMVEGESGILACSPLDFRPEYEPSKRRLTWPNGSMATTYSGDEPDLLRGPQHGFAWCDELAAWRYPETWDQLLFGLRLGSHPRAIVTTTPRPAKLVRALLSDPRCYVTRGSTFDNPHLPQSALTDLRKRYESTRLGRQELYAEVLTDTPGALWTYALCERAHRNPVPDLARIVVAIDPAVSAEEGSDETGIVAAGVDKDRHGWVLADRSGILTPDQWARRAVDLYKDLRADRIVAEANQGGLMVEHTIRTVSPDVPVKLVHASRAKQARAEPVAALYEQDRVHHAGALAELEEQLCGWVPGGPSPDRLDALVWALTDLIVDGPPSIIPASDDGALDAESPWELR